MTRRLFWRREPKEPLTPGRHRYTYGHGAEDVLCECRPDYQCEHNGPMPLPAVSHVDTARPAADLSAAPGQPTPGDCPQQSESIDAPHVGATEEFGAELAAMRERLDADVEHGVTALDPAEQARQREELAWEEAFARAEGAIDMEAARGRRVVTDALDAFLPGWADAICERRSCTLCVHDFAEAMETAGVIALPAAPVDYSTAEYAVVG